LVWGWETLIGARRGVEKGVVMVYYPPIG